MNDNLDLAYVTVLTFRNVDHGENDRLIDA